MSLDLSLAERDGWWYRKGLQSQDWTTIRTAYTEDEYHLLDLRMARRNECIVDVGACIGGFTRRAHERNPHAHLFAVEALAENIPCLTANVGTFATVIPAAMTYEPDPAILSSLTDDTKASGGSVVKPRREVESYSGGQYERQLRPLDTITLEEVMGRWGIDYIDCLKLDCEGSEYSILANATCLGRVGCIVGEYHGGRDRWNEFVAARFAADRWWHYTYNWHDHMGNFWLTSRERPGWLK